MTDRDSRTRENADLSALKRQTYSKALNQVELVASKVAILARATGEERAEFAGAFWDELVVAYQIKNEIRLMARTQEPA